MSRGEFVEAEAEAEAPPAPAVDASARLLLAQQRLAQGEPTAPVRPQPTIVQRWLAQRSDTPLINLSRTPIRDILLAAGRPAIPDDCLAFAMRARDAMKIPGYHLFEAKDLPRLMELAALS